ncbi:MAG: DNA-processing protein DprA [Oscillospiraceae bacterium]|jgi:DNA processing protein|nr:DNA-processing protein DprA [Oscillospiraceae bacterium]
MYNELYYVWLQAALSVAGTKASRALEVFGSARAVYEAAERETRLAGFFSAVDVERLCQKSISGAQKTLDDCFKQGIEVITPENPRYPVRLREIWNYPAVLYARGEIPDVDSLPTVAVVGTRDASPIGAALAELLSKQLASAGTLVISGGALGIDTAAHAGALSAAGKTIMVAGCGLDIDYPRQNARLKEVIAKNGAVISEFPPGTPPAKVNFPIRNRIISGLSLGVAVMECGKKSGSLITAGLALDQGRDVFALPDPSNAGIYSGTAYLLEDGATPITCALDVLAEYVPGFGHKLNLTGTDTPLLTLLGYRPKYESANQTTENKAEESDKKAKSAARRRINSRNKPEEKRANLSGKNVSCETFFPFPEDLSEMARRIWAGLNVESELDEICEKVKISAGDALCALTELEMEGLVRQTAGTRYKRRE